MEETRDWAKECEKFEESNFLKLEAGTHKITFLDNGNSSEINIDGKMIPKVQFKVKYKDENFTWTVSQNNIYYTVWSQISLLGRRDGTLINNTYNVTVKGSGKNKDYTFDGAVELTQKDIERRKSESLIN